MDKNEGLELEVVDCWIRGDIDPKNAAKFSELMESISLSAAIYLAKTVNLKEKYNISSLLDVAGGSGCYSIAFSTYQPGIKSIVLDLKEVCKVAQTYIEKSEAPKNSVLTYELDMFREPFPLCTDEKYGYNGIFLSQIVHDWDEKTDGTLLKKCFDSLPSNGYIFIHEALLNEEGSGPLVVALYSFDMFIMSKGKQYKLSEIRKMLIACGFENIESIKAYGLYSFVTARKP